MGQQTYKQTNKQTNKHPQKLKLGFVGKAVKLVEKCLKKICL
jgi:hypothetical protein